MEIRSKLIAELNWTSLADDSWAELIILCLSVITFRSLSTSRNISRSNGRRLASEENKRPTSDPAKDETADASSARMAGATRAKPNTAQSVWPAAWRGRAPRGDLSTRKSWPAAGGVAAARESVAYLILGPAQAQLARYKAPGWQSTVNRSSVCGGDHGGVRTPAGQGH